WGPALVPTAVDTAPTFSRQVRVVGDAPESHTSGKKAAVDAIKHIFDEARARFAGEIGKGRRLGERALRFAQPPVRLVLGAEYFRRKLRHAGEPDRPVGFLDGERFAALHAAGKGPPRHHECENLVLRIPARFERAQGVRRRARDGRPRFGRQGFAGLIG